MIELSPSRAGVVFAFTAALCYAGLNMAIRFADAYTSIWHIIFYRSLFGAGAMVLLARLTGVGILGRQRMALCMVGISGAVGVTALTVALILLPLFEALVLLYLFPAFSALLSPALTRDRVTRQDWLFILTACTGAVMVLWSGQRFAGLSWGHSLGLVASFSLGLTFTLIRRTSARNSPLTPFFYICAAGILVSVVPMAAEPVGPLVPSAGLPSLAAVALLATAAHLYGNRALVHLSSPRVGVILMSEVVFGAAIGRFVFGESIGLQTLLGGLLIVGSGIGLNLGKQKI